MYAVVKLDVDSRSADVQRLRVKHPGAGDHKVTVSVKFDCLLMGFTNARVIVIEHL